MKKLKKIQIPVINKTKEFLNFEKYFFGKIDPYMAWHDGVETLIDLNTLKKLNNEETIAAESLLFNSLLDGFDERWIIGLEEIKSDKLIEICDFIMTKTDSDYIKIRLSEAILKFRDSKDCIDFFIKTIISPEKHYSIKIKALSSLKILVSLNKLNITENSTLNNALLQLITDKDYLVRYHAYDLLKRIYNFNISTESKKDEIFKLITKQNTLKQFIKAQKMIIDKIDQKIR